MQRSSWRPLSSGRTSKTDRRAAVGGRVAGPMQVPGVYLRDGGENGGGVLELVAMCGRFTQKYTWHEIRDLYELVGAARQSG
jgi:hypothetical protein